MYDARHERIALSASFYGKLSVRALLNTCDLIYTTQAGSYEDLVMRFGTNRIKIIPNSSGEMQNLIMSWHCNAEFFTFSDLLHLSEAEDFCIGIPLSERVEYLVEIQQKIMELGRTVPVGKVAKILHEHETDCAQAHFFAMQMLINQSRKEF